MDFNTYQNKAVETAIFENKGQLGFLKFQDKSQDGIINFTSFIYPVLGLCGEAGEVAEKIKKIIRDDEGIVSEDKLNAIKKELGDVLWYLAVLSRQFDLDLQTIAEENIEKLQNRKANNTLAGSGDNR